jgi:hypothetical protein
MATQQNQPCATCQGGGVVNAGGNVQACPMCDGTGKAYIPGLFYNYAIMISLTANQALQQTISILNAAFKWIFLVSTQTAAFTLQLSDAKNLRQFMNVPLHYSLVCGTAQNPFPVLNPYVFDQNGAIQINVLDLSGATNTIWLNFIGVQLVPSVQSGH